MNAFDKPRVRLPSAQTSAVDGLINVVSGLGTAQGKRAHNQFAYSGLNNYQELDASYQTNWIARQIVDIPAGDMCREWRTIKSSGAEAIQAEEQRIGLRFACEEALSWARLFGGGGILMITNQDLSKPLDINEIGKGDLERLLTFDRWEMSPQTINTWNVLAPNYLLPEFYTIQGGTQQIHWTHFARFNGARLPRRQMAQTSGWGDSELRKCMEDLKDTVSAKGGIAELMQEASVDIITREGLSDDLASDQDEAITNRYSLFSQMKSIVNLALLDGDETYDRKTLQLSGVSQTLEVLMVWLAGAADIPVTRLFGTSAKGLNATGEGDLSNYYDSIRAKQGVQLAQPLQYFDQVLVRSALGNYPDDYDYIWNPLKQPNQVETAQAQLLQAQKNRIYLEDNVVMQSQIQKNLQANEEYQFNDGQIEDAEKAEASNPFDVVDPVESEE
jgi:phage-related protein (TIGR01555 family)